MLYACIYVCVLVISSNIQPFIFLSRIGLCCLLWWHYLLHIYIYIHTKKRTYVNALSVGASLLTCFSCLFTFVRVFCWVFIDMLTIAFVTPNMWREFVRLSASCASIRWYGFYLLFSCGFFGFGRFRKFWWFTLWIEFKIECLSISRLHASIFILMPPPIPLPIIIFCCSFLGTPRLALTL